MSDISEEQLKMYEEAFRAYVKKAAIGNQVGEILEELDEDMKKEGFILYDELDLAAFLQPLISDENEYVLDGARIRCSAMTKEMQEIPDYSRGYEIIHKFSVPMDDEEVLVATTALKSEVNGIKYATIDDRQRFYAEGSQVGMAMSSAGVKPNIYSFGNCRAVTEKDWPAILLNEKYGKKYGTCYCLMKLEEQWENPPCIESALGFASCESECSIDGELHTKPMMFSTAKGDREGLTMLATLYCKSKRGIITIETSGQVKMPVVGQTSVGVKIPAAEGVGKFVGYLEGYGKFTEEDYNYLVALGLENREYEGFVAVAYVVLNRARNEGKSIREIASSGEFTGYRVEAVGKPINEEVEKAALDVLQGKVENPIGDSTFYLGRANGYDLWYEAERATYVKEVGKNIFFTEWGTVHNMQSNQTDDAVVIYDASANEGKGEWLMRGLVVGNE